MDNSKHDMIYYLYTDGKEMVAVKKRIVLVLTIILVLLVCVACGDTETPRSRGDSVADKEEENKNQTDKNQTDKNQTDENQSDKTESTEQDEIKRVKLPDVSGTDLDSAKAVLIGKGFLIIIEEEYSDSVKAGEVIGTNPKGGEMLEENSKVVLLISKGPSMIECKDATISWYHIDSDAPDDWNFAAPIIYEDKLYIECETIFGTDFTFKGKGFGNASLTDTFDKKTPISILDSSLKELPENKQVKKGETESFVLCIPLAQLDSERPTHVACELVILVGEKEMQINVSFNISW